MNDVQAIILAAGLSRRMGEQNKLLLPINGIPMIRHMVDTYTAVRPRQLLVITGHQAREIEAALDGSPAVTVFNPDYAQGQQTSVVCGLRAAKDDAVILLGLGDQPLLTSDDLRALLAAHAEGDGARISIPVQGPHRGNPIVIPVALRQRLLDDPKSPGCRTFTRALPDQVQFHEMQAKGFFADIDTPQAYREFAKRDVEKTQ